MCLAPVKIKNPYNSKTSRRNFILASFHDVDSEYIEVPCGVCAECLSMRQNYWLQRCELLSTDHYIFFATLTYSNSTVPFLISTGKDDITRKYLYADPHDFTAMIKRMRVYGIFPRGMKYLCCSEYGGQTHRPHFHVLFFIPKKDFIYTNNYDKCNCNRFYFRVNDPFSVLNYESFLFKELLSHWKRRVSTSRKYPHYIRLCRYVRSSDGRSTYDLHFVEPYTDSGKTSADVCAYVTKYILKPDPWIRKVRQALYNNYYPEEYLRLWKILKPRFLFSKNFGNSEDYRDTVENFIEMSKTGISKYEVCFYDLYTGKAYPLAPYLQKKFLKWQDSLELRARKMESEGFSRWDSIADYNAKRIKEQTGWNEYQEKFKKRQRYERVRSLVFLRCSDEFFTDTT